MNGSNGFSELLIAMDLHQLLEIVLWKQCQQIETTNLDSKLTQMQEQKIIF